MARRQPQRMCVACRTMKDKSSLIRLVLTPEQCVELDTAGKKPGRGAYVCRDQNCLRTALREHKFERGLKTRIDQAVIDHLVQELESMPDEEKR
ncbi:MAG: YlxR family protein [Eubacteriales bacterium]|nr:YlxR family protein [Eubacteriales bacterium]MDD4460741.1 YlxR family protein [Eubacteriales bacterium]